MRTAGHRFRLVALGVLLAGCSVAPTPTASGPGSTPAFVAEVASYQLLAGEPNRFLVGLFGGEGKWVSFGSASLRFASIDDPSLSIEPVEATFLPLPGTPRGEGESSQLTAASHGRGVYAAREVRFPQPGYWQVTASVELDGQAEEAATVFEVLAEPQVPAVGDPAPDTDHPVAGDAVDARVLDSRARGDEEPPDAALHELSIADAIRAGRPAVVAFTTPVYCTSRFCGPITEMVAEMATEADPGVAFIHVEVWSDFEAEAANPAAEEWLTMSGGELREPWTFLIDRDGRIAGSWDNVVTRDELEAAMAALPGAGE